MAQRQLNVRSDEAYDRASRLSKQLQKTTTDVVVDALRLYEGTSSPVDELGLTPEQRRRFEELEAAAARFSKHVIPGSPSDHDWLYDEHGLPK